MKKRIPVFLLIAAIVYLIVFAYFFKSTKGDVSTSLKNAGIVTGALAIATVFGSPDITRAQINATNYKTDIGTGGIIDKLAEQNRHLEEQNRILKEQGSTKSDITEDYHAFTGRN